MKLQFDSYVWDTDNAICLQIGDEGDVWFPRSVCEDVDLNEQTVEVKGWFVLREGLEQYAI